jgi:hypothetical protein
MSGYTDLASSSLLGAHIDLDNRKKARARLTIVTIASRLGCIDEAASVLEALDLIPGVADEPHVRAGAVSEKDTLKA